MSAKMQKRVLTSSEIESILSFIKPQKGIPEEKKTFDVKLAVLVLAFSLPFSTVLILSILTAGDYFADVNTLIVTGLTMTAAGILPRLYSKVILPSLSKTVNADA